MLAGKYTTSIGSKSSALEYLTRQDESNLNPRESYIDRFPEKTLRYFQEKPYSGQRKVFQRMTLAIRPLNICEI
eukprot:scaffold30985_cov38-Cyclotella_meneghiniana.AAC.5